MSGSVDSKGGPTGGAAGLQGVLRARLDRPVVVVLTDNRQRLLSSATRGGVTTLRLHRRFVDAPATVTTAVADILDDNGDDAVRARARGVLRAWWRAIDGDGDYVGEGGGGTAARSPVRSVAAPPGGGMSPPATAWDAANLVGVTARGAHHDLALYGKFLNDTYLDGRSMAAIRWGARARRRGTTRSIRLGCFFPAGNRILMNRRLDREDIPRYFIEYVLFHEMLHEVLGIGQRPDGRRDIHGSLFRLMERTYPQADAALAFERRYFGG